MENQTATTTSEFLFENRSHYPGIISFLNVSKNWSNNTGNSSQMVAGPSSMSKPEWIVVPSVFAFIFMVGVLGNGILILIVAVNRNMKTTPNVLLVSLATGDLLLILISSPFTSVYYFYDEWPFGEIMCKLNEFLFTLSLGVSVFTLTALSGERYMVIVFPMQSRRGANSMAKAILTAIMIWIVSAMLASLDLFMAQVVYLQGTKSRIATCIPFPLESATDPVTKWYSKFYTIFRFLVYFLIPIVIIATFYIFMAVILLRSSVNMPGEAEVKSRTVKQVEARKNVARIVLACVFIFIFCWLPRHVYMFWFYFDPGHYNMFWHLFKIFGFCLAFMNSCVNPFALYFLSDQFRRYYNRYLFKKLCSCFAPFCKKKSTITEATIIDEETATSGKRSTPEMRNFKPKGATSNHNNDVDKSRTAKAIAADPGTNAGDGGGNSAAGKLRSRFVIFEGKKDASGKKQRRRKSSNTANGKINQKILKNSKKNKKSEVGVPEADNKTGLSTV